MRLKNVEQSIPGFGGKLFLDFFQVLFFRGHQKLLNRTRIVFSGTDYYSETVVGQITKFGLEASLVYLQARRKDYQKLQE